MIYSTLAWPSWNEEGNSIEQWLEVASGEKNDRCLPGLRPIEPSSSLALSPDICFFNLFNMVWYWLRRLKLMYWLRSYSQEIHLQKLIVLFKIVFNCCWGIERSKKLFFNYNSPRRHTLRAFAARSGSGSKNLTMPWNSARKIHGFGC